MGMPAMTIDEQKLDQRIDRESGSLIMTRVFQVARAGHEAHIVRIEVSEAGTPQTETCDCKSFRFRRACRHIEAIYASGVLGGNLD